MPGAGRFETLFSMRSAVPGAGTGNCLQAVKLLVPRFNGASQRCKVGKILEADARPHLKTVRQRI